MTQLLKVDEVATRLAIGRTLIYDLMGAGELPFIKVGRTRRIVADDLEAFIERSRIGGNQR